MNKENESMRFLDAKFMKESFCAQVDELAVNGEISEQNLETAYYGTMDGEEMAREDGCLKDMPILSPFLWLL
ncbi:MAG: hypothetical protein V1711_02785 [bacterium]